MKPYRPKGWKPINRPFYVINQPQGNYISAGDANSLYEAGADAILEGLRKSGVPVPNIKEHKFEGHMVLIPPDEEK